MPNIKNIIKRKSALIFSYDNRCVRYGQLKRNISAIILIRKLKICYAFFNKCYLLNLYTRGINSPEFIH